MTSTATTGSDPLAAFDEERRHTLSSVADLLIPAAHGMPSAGDVIGDARLRFVLKSRPDLAEPLLAALRPDLGDEPARRLESLERDEPEHHAALLQAVVFAYYTDRGVRERLGYPGQLAKELYSWKLPPYIEEGLTAQVLARGPIWRDPATGRRAAAQRPTGRRAEKA